MRENPVQQTRLQERAPVSVIVPCYQCSATVERTLQSVAEQTWMPREVLLVDDGNDDVTKHVLQSQPARFVALDIRVISLSRNQGVASARNAGWDAATQPYIAFLDADDAWHAKKLELQVQFMQAHPEVVITAHRLDDHAKGYLDEELAQAPIFRRVPCRRLLVSNLLSASSVVLQSSLALRFNASQRYSEDYALWLEASCRGVPIARTDCVLGYRFKAAYGASGLSAALWRMERAELGNYRSLRREGLIGRLALAALTALSFAKFVRRALVSRCTRRRAPISRKAP